MSGNRTNFRRLFRYNGESAYSYYARRFSAFYDSVKWLALCALLTLAVFDILK